MPHHLTVIYGGLSRYDKAQNPPVPFAGNAGELFIERTFRQLPPTIVDLRVVDTPDIIKPYVQNTRFLLLGEAAQKQFFPGETNLLKQRGIVQLLNGRPAIATFHPIDCYDFKAIDLENFENEGDEDEKEESKDVGPTSRINYLHWAMLDYRKLMTLQWPLPVSPPDYPIICPPVDFAVNWLTNRKNEDVIIDIETRRQDHSLDCIGFRASGQTVVVPFYGPDNRLYYGPYGTARIFRALLTLFTNKTIRIVGHNLGFDLSVLCFRYGLPLPPSLHDTMLAMHREFPQLEKSLSHALSLYTTATRNHKGDIAVNVSTDNFRRLLAYNANDVLWTERILESQRFRATSNDSLRESVETANSILRCTLLMTFTGIRIDSAARDQQIALAMLQQEQYTRCLHILTQNPDFNPASPPQCAALLYTKLKYPIKETTETGAPATGTKILLKLQVEQPNPIIPLIIAAREAAKAASMLRFRTKTKKLLIHETASVPQNSCA